MAYNRTDDLLERLLQAVEGGSGLGGGGTLRSGRGGSQQPSNEDISALISRSKEAAREFNSLKNGIRFTTRQQQAFGDATADANQRLGEVNRVLSAYRNGQISLSSQQKKQLEAERARLASLEDGTKQNAAFVSGVQQVRQNLEQFGSQMIQGNAQVVQAIQSGASGFTIAGQSIIASAQLQNTAVQSMAGMATSAGGALMNFGGILGKIAGGAIVLGAQFMGLQSALKTQAKQLQIQTLMQGGEQILKAFQEMTAAGASYVGGLATVQSALKGSDYTLQDFSAMVKANSETLAKANMSVGDAALMFGRVGAIFDKDGKKMRKELLALGFSYQEQGALMADVMADMRRQDPTAKLAANQVAQQTKEYAVHLATIADLTGKNARQLMEEGRKKTAQLAFQNFLQTFNDPKIASKVEQAVAGIADPVLQQNIMERLTFGGVINKTGATMEALNPALEALSRELEGAARQGKGAEEFMRIQEKYSKAVNQGFLNQREANLAMAAPNSKIEALGTASLTTRTYINQMGDASKTFAEKMAIANKEPVGLTGQVIDMTILGKKLEKELQDGVIARLHILSSHMDSYLKKINSILDAHVPSAKEIIEMQLNMLKEAMKTMADVYWKEIKKYAKEFWEGLSADTKTYLWIGGVVAGAAIGLYALGKAAQTFKTMLDGWRMISGQGLPGTGGTVESGRDGRGSRAPQYGRRGTPNVPVPEGKSFGPAGKFESFIFNMFKAFGMGAGAVISGIMRGIAVGIGAFGNPKILLGAAILSGSILVLGAGIAGATWIMGKALPSLAEGLAKFQQLDGEKLTQAGKGAAAVAAGVAAFTLLGSATVLSNLFNSISEGLLGLFGVKSPLEKMKDFAKAGPELATGAAGIKTFADALKTLQDLDLAKIERIGTGLEKIKGSMSKGFFEGIFTKDVDVDKIRQLKESLGGGGGLTAQVTGTNQNGIGIWNGLRTYNGKLLVSIDSDSIMQMKGSMPINAPRAQTNTTSAALDGSKVVLSMDPVVNKLEAVLGKNGDLYKVTNEEIKEILERLLVAYKFGNDLKENTVREHIKTNRNLMKAF